MIMLTRKEKEVIIEAFCEDGVRDVWRTAQDILDNNRVWRRDGKCILEKNYVSGSVYQLKQLGRVNNKSAMDFISRLHTEKEKAYKNYFL